MKYTKEERLEIGKRIHTREITYREAMEQYGISETAAHKYLADYREENGIRLADTWGKRAIPAPDMEAYMSMSREELINELIKAKANELRAKKGYEVKGDGADKEFIIINNGNSR